jgi:Na+/H+ antiporter NhaD/arsenite permease-like protein
MIARKIVEYFHTTRLCVLALVYITFIGSMLIANDMALLTFLPLGFYVLHSTRKEKYMAYVFILQNIAANLGGMLTPFGNPQNLYLYTRFHIPNAEFLRIMFPPFFLAVILLTVCCFFVKGEPMILSSAKNPEEHHRRKTVLYMALFALSIAIVFRSVPYWVGLLVIPVVLFFADRHALRMVDYPLLLTFVFFFIFAGNMARIEPIKELLSSLLEKNTLLFSVISCQFISNVPSAVLLSNFTGDYSSLLVGVNIGGVGTLISSLASLITFREYTKNNLGKTAKYVALFSVLNFGFLIALTAFSLAIV